MSKKPQEKGPYKHYERPTTSRSQMHSREERKAKKGHPQIWAGIIIVAIILIAAVPILGAKMHSNQSHNIAEKSVQTTKTSKKSSSKKKKSVKKKKSKKSKKSAAQSSSVDKAASSSSSQEVDTQESSSSSDQTQNSTSSDDSSSDSQFKADSNGNYTVQDGDTLSEIARANNTTVDNLMKINGISKQNHVVSGQTIRVKADDDSSSDNSEN